MDAWAPLIAELSGQVSVFLGKDTGVPPGLDFSPSLALVSGDLYPAHNQELVRMLNAAYPEMDIIVLAPPTAPHVPLRPLMMDKVRHLAVADPFGGAKRLSTLIRTIDEGKNWELMSYLRPETDYRDFQIGGLDEKEWVLSCIEDMVGGATPDLQCLRQSAILLADEMIENAFQAAPPDARGQDTITVKAGFDNETLALQVADVWGTLTPEKALELLTRHQEGQVSIDSPRGRGLFILWQFFDHLHINIKPGRETAIGGQLRRASHLKLDQPKGFDFFHSLPQPE
jgi:anti-sigma regulatory factor (Ser/Thr protein kinase)